MSVNDEDIDIRVTLRNELSKPARKVEESLDDIADAAKRADRRVKELDRSLRNLEDTSVDLSESISDLHDSVEESSKAMDDHSNAVGDSSESMGHLGKTTGQVTKDTDKNTKATDKNTKSKKKSTTQVKKTTVWIRDFNKVVTGSFKSFGGFLGGYFNSLQMIRGILFSEIAPMIPLLVTGIASLGSAVIALIGPMGQLASNGAVILPLYAAIGMTVGVLSMAFGGLGDAVSALSDPTLTAEELAEALEGLGPNAISFAKALVPITKEFKAIKSNVQETFLSGGLTTALTQFTDKFLPILNRELEDAAENLSIVGEYALNAFGKPKEMDSIENVLDTASKNAGLFGMALTSIGRILLFITEAAGPQLTRFLTYVSDSFADIADGMDKGDLAEYFERAGDMAAGAWSGIQNFFKGIRNMAKAAAPLTEHLSGGLGDLMKRFADWTASDEGQSKMGKFFEDMIPNLDAIGNLIGALWDEMGKMTDNENFSKFINDIADNGIPALGELIRQLSDGLVPVFLDLSEAYQKFTEDNPVTIVQPMIDLFTLLGDAVKGVSEVIGGLPPEVKGVLTYMSGLALIGFQVLAPFRLIKSLFGMIFGKGDKVKKTSKGFTVFKDVLKKVGKAFSWVWKGIGKLFGFFKPLLGWIGKLAGKVGFGGIMKVVGFLGKRLVSFAGGPVGIILGALWLLWDGLKLAYDHFEWFRDIVDSAAKVIKDVWNAVADWWINTFVPMLGDGIDSVVEWFRNIPNVVRDVVQSIEDWWNGLVEWFQTFIISNITNFVLGIVGLFGDIREGISNVVSRIREVWNGIVDWFQTNIIDRIATFVASAVAEFVRIRNGVSDVIDRIRGVWNSIVDWFQLNIVARIATFVTSAVAEFVRVRNGVRNVIDRIRDTWNNVVDWLDDNIISRVRGFIDTAISTFDRIGDGVGDAMNQIRSAASKPVDFVVNTVYNDGIRAMWNRIADTFDLNTLPPVSFSGSNGSGGSGKPNNRFATGGVLPGYSPGKDIHHFTSPTGGNLHLSGGEAIMRPEFTKAVGGESGVHQLNAMARAGQLNQAFANGGITDFAGDLAKSAWNGVKSAGKAIWGGAKEVGNAVKGFVTDPLGTLKKVVTAPAEALYGQIPKGGGEFAQGLLNIPKKIISSLTSKVKGNDPKYTATPPESGGTLGKVHMGPPPKGGSWVRPSAGPITQRYGVPGVLSGLAHAGTDIAGGGKTYAAGAGTVYATGSGILRGRSGLGIGISHGGGIFTYYGHNPVGGIQVRPGQEVKAGQHIGYQGSTGNVTGTHLHFELHKGGWGRNVNPSAVGVYDTGGWLMPGQQAINMSSTPEPILNGEQFGWLKAAATAGAYRMKTDPVYSTATTRGGGGTTTIIHEGNDIFAPNVQVTIERVESEVDIEKAFKKAMAKYERERKERK